MGGYFIFGFIFKMYIANVFGFSLLRLLVNRSFALGLLSVVARYFRGIVGDLLMLGIRYWRWVSDEVGY